MVAQRILVIDDQVPIVELVADILSDAGYEVTAVADPGPLLSPDRPALDYDLMVIDIVMPQIDGITLRQLLRRSGCRCPTLFITGLVNHRFADPGRNILHKPFRPQELLDSVNRLLT